MFATRTTTDRRFSNLLPALLAATLLLPGGSLLAGDRVVASVGERFEINGEIFDGGRIGLRQVLRYSPVATIHEVCVDGTCAGMMMSEESGVPGEAPADELIFTRATAGHLVLAGVAFAGQPARTLTVTGPPAAPVVPERPAATLLAAR